MACELIEKIPGKVSGRPIVRGTRILPDAIVDSYDRGEAIEELKVLLDENRDHASASCDTVSYPITHHQEEPVEDHRRHQ